MDEIQNLIPSFRAVVMAEITKARQHNGNLNTVESFATAVIIQRDRYLKKLTAIRSAPANFAIDWMAEAAENQITSITDHEIARAKHYGRVEFAP
jgi:hypothetical protein